MSDMRDRIAAVLTAHRQDFYEQDMGECPCGFKGTTYDDHDRHKADEVVRELERFSSTPRHFTQEAGG